MKRIFLCDGSHWGKFVSKHRFYYYSGVVRPFDQEMIAIEKSFLLIVLKFPHT